MAGDWGKEIRRILPAAKDAAEAGRALYMGDGDWGKEIRRILQAAKEADEIHRALWESLPAEMPEPRGKLMRDAFRQLAEINDAASVAFDRYCLGPVRKFIEGYSLSREEYYLLVAMQILSGGQARGVGPYPMDDYEVFQMLCYEDAERRCYINFEESPRDYGAGRTMINLRFGKAPEELRLNALRPEQRQFFERYLPADYGRFKKE